MKTDELRALLAKATPGPWEKRHEEDVQDYTPEIIDLPGPLYAECGVNMGAIEHHGQQGHNARLIVAAVNALPALLDVAEAAARVRKEWAAAVCTDAEFALCAALDRVVPKEPTR